MMAWSATARRSAASGLLRLLSRSQWRESRYGSELIALGRKALEDSDRVVRFFAADATIHIYSDEPSRLVFLRQRLLVEDNDHVAAAIVGQLSFLSSSRAAEIDKVLSEVLPTPRWEQRLAQTSSESTDTLSPLIQLVLLLALRERSPFATSVAQRWVTDTNGDWLTRRTFGGLRRWLALSPSDERKRAFDLIKEAATTLEELRATVTPEELERVYKAADSLITELYFASGAHGDRGDPRAAPEGFAEEALAVLELMVLFKHPSITHRIVETLAHLAPADPRRTLLLLDRAVEPGDRYTYDKLAADKTIALIERYLAEFRDLVTTDASLLTAVRGILDAFVRVGWPEAVSLSYRLGEVFR